jgi:long-subunit acyl-CoA synthetase (AMP-forming)
MTTETRGADSAPEAGWGPTTLADILAYRERASGDAVFVTTQAGEPSTYAQVCGAVRALARELVGLGVSDQDNVGLYFPNCPAWIVASFASWALRCAAITCGTLVTAREAEAQLRSAGVGVVVTTTPSRFTGL